MENRKNILILMHNDATQFIDIANQYVKLFDKNKYKVTVAYLSGNPDENTKNKTISEEVLFLNCSKKSIRGLKIKAIQQLIELCRQEKFNIVIAHRYKPIYIMLWAAQFCRIPTLVFVLHAMKTISHFTRKCFIALLVRRNMYFAGVSDAVRNDLRASLWGIPDSRVITLYNCIDMQTAENRLFSKSEARQFLKIPENTLAIGTVARLVPDKDQKNIIQAFAKVKPHFPHAILFIIGNGELEQELKQLAKQHHLENDIVFTGFVPDAQRYLKALDIFVLSSIEEAFGRVLLEAMIARVPVIGTRIDGIPEVIGDAGLVVEARDSQLLSSAINQLAQLSPEERSTLGDKGYDRVKEKFSTDKFNEDFWKTVMPARF